MDRCKRCGWDAASGTAHDEYGCGNVHFEFGYLFSAVDAAVKEGKATNRLAAIYADQAPLFPHLVTP